MTDIIKPAFSDTDVEVLQQETVYQGYFQIKKYLLRHRLFAGGWSQPFVREVFERGHAAAVLLFDPILDKMVLVEQFRIGTLGLTSNPWLLELVAGIIDKDETETQVAIREAKEEAGLTILDLIPIYDYWVSPGGSTERLRLFCGRVDASKAGGVHGLAEESEDIRVWVLNPNEVYQALATGRINNALSIIAIQWFQLHEAEVRKLWANTSST